MSKGAQKLQIIPLGGLGEIGKNMTVIRVDDEILVIDSGLMFPEEDMLGIDLVIPDISYLIENRDMIKVRTSEKDARHFWSIVHINGGWYHFDSTPFKAGHDYFFMATDAEMKAWDKKYYPGTHVYKTEGMPEFAAKSVQSRVDYSSPKLKK